MKKFLFFLPFILPVFIIPFWGFSPVDDQSTSGISKELKSVLHWMPNQGQFDDKTAFIWRSDLASIRIDQQGSILYSIRNGKDWFHTEEHPLGVEGDPDIEAENILPTTVNFIKGKTEKHRFDVPTYNDIHMDDLWPGIRLSLQTTGHSVEKLLEIAPGAEPSRIWFGWDNANEICVNQSGELQIDLGKGSLFFSRPIAWQNQNGKRIPVDVKFVVDSENTSYSFATGPYDSELALFIDPLLSSGFIGGTLWDFSQVVKIGKSGKVYVGGITESDILYTTPSAYDPVFNDSTDIFMAIYDASLQNLLQFTYFGGHGAEVLSDMVLDSMDNIYFTGRTQSKNFPVTSNAYDTTFNNAENPWLHDMFISCLNSEGSALLYSTYLGSKGEDFGRAIGLDSAQHVIVAGISSEGLPPVGPQFTDQTTSSCVIAKLDPTLSHLMATNMIDANDNMLVNALVIDSSDQVFVTGDTYATVIPVTAGCFSNTSAGHRDVFVFRINNDLSKLLACTFLGGKEMDYSYGMITDSHKNVYITGSTESPDFPVSLMAYDQINDFFSNDAFISKLDSTLHFLEFSTFLGGKGNETGYDLCFDSLGNVLVTGYTTSEDFPVFCDSYDQSWNMDDDAFISRLNPELTLLLGSTYIGGTGNDHSYSITLNQGDTVYIAGYTTSADFPNYGAADISFQGGPSDGFVLSIDPELNQHYPCCSELIFPLPESIEVRNKFTLTWNYVSGADRYLVKLRTSSGSSDYDDKILDAGNKNTLEIFDLPCGDTAYVQVQPLNQNGFLLEDGEIVFACETYWFVLVEPFFENETAEICEGEQYTWQNESYSEGGTHTVIHTATNGCDSIYQLELTVFPTYFEMDEAEICEGESYFFGGEYYSETGIFYQDFNSINGCDSVLSLNLMVNPTYDTSLFASICEGESFEWQGLSLTIAGTYTNTLQSVAGCDSMVHLELMVNPVFTQLDQMNICPGETVYWQGFNLSLPGNYSASYQSQFGCDSLYLLDLDYDPAFEFTDSLLFCEGDTLYWQGQTITHSGNYAAQYSTMNGCDSTYYLFLDYYPEYLAEDEQIFCAGDQVIWQGLTLNVPGTYSVIYESQEGCDSTFQLELIQAYPDTSLQINGDTLWVEESEEGFYQWLLCPEMTEIPGANEPVFVAEQSGSYAVEVESQGCIDTSACQAIIHSNVPGSGDVLDVTIFPNPVYSRFLYIMGSKEIGEIHLQLVNIHGISVLEKTIESVNETVWMGDFTPGIYILKLNNGRQEYAKKILNLPN